jgi:hypothetical protein
VRAIYRSLGAAAGIAILAACTSGQSAIQPPSSSANVQQNSTLQFAVGTANYGGAATYLNTVVTFRQPGGLSATLYNTPTITGPAGFTVPAAGSAGTDAGTNHISGTPPTQPGTAAVATTFNQIGGAFAYGFAPANSSTSGAAYYPGNPSGRGSPSNVFASALGVVPDVYAQPFYIAAASKLQFLLGPPATPDFHNPNAGYPAGFAGYDSGFMMFGATPVAGSYTLNLNVPSNTVGNPTAVFNATATLTSVVPMATEATPVIAEPTTPGGAVNFVVTPAPAGAVSQVLYVVDINGASGALTFYSFNAGTAGGTFTLPAADFHPANSNPPANTTNDTVIAYTVAANWDIVGDAPPGNTSTAPPLPAQTNISVSAPNSLTYL